MKKRNYLISGLILILVLSTQYVFAADSGALTIKLNGTSIEAKAYEREGSLYLPVRKVCEPLGYDVGWSQTDQTVTIDGNGKSISLNFKESKIKSNDHDYFMTDGNVVIGNRTYMKADFFSDYFPLKIQWDKAKNPVRINSITENTIKIKTVKEASETRALIKTVQYPQIEGLESKVIQDEINGIFKGLAGSAVQEGIKNVADLAPYVLQNPDMPSQCETYFNYQVKYNQNNVLSLIFLDYQYAGGAHGSTVESSYTINLKTGKMYSLKDLFKEKTDYSSVISGSVKRQLNERGLTEGLLEPFNKISDNQGFYLSNNGIMIYFQQYEILPYAAGIQEFLVENALLKDLIAEPDLFKDDGLLYKNELLGFGLKFPQDWAENYEIVSTTDGIKVYYIPLEKSLQKEILFSVINYGTEAQWNKDWHSLEQKAGVINGDVYAYIDRADFPYDPTDPKQMADSQIFSDMYSKVDSIAKSFMEIPNSDKSATMLLKSILDTAKKGKVINSIYPANTTVIEDVIKEWGQPYKTDYIAEAKGIYDQFPAHKVVFGFNKGSQIFEVRSFDMSLHCITKTKALEVLGKPDYTNKIDGEEVIGYKTGGDYHLLLVFSEDISKTGDARLDHYSVLYPQGTVNLMSGDPGREW